jgi:hypothetical protein
VISSSPPRRTNAREPTATDGAKHRIGLLKLLHQPMTPWEFAAAYHQETKHHYDRYARSLGYLDWAAQPERRFPLAVGQAIL